MRFLFLPLLLLLAGCNRDVFYQADDDVPAEYQRCHPPTHCLRWECSERAWPVLGRCVGWEENGQCHVCPVRAP